MPQERATYAAGSCLILILLGARPHFSPSNGCAASEDQRQEGLEERHDQLQRHRGSDKKGHVETKRQRQTGLAPCALAHPAERNSPSPYSPWRAVAAVTQSAKARSSARKSSSLSFLLREWVIICEPKATDFERGLPGQRGDGQSTEQRATSSAAPGSDAVAVHRALPLRAQAGSGRRGDLKPASGEQIAAISRMRWDDAGRYAEPSGSRGLVRRFATETSFIGQQHPQAEGLPERPLGSKAIQLGTFKGSPAIPCASRSCGDPTIEKSRVVWRPDESR